MEYNLNSYTINLQKKYRYLGSLPLVRFQSYIKTLKATYVVRARQLYCNCLFYKTKDVFLYNTI